MRILKYDVPLDDGWHEIGFGDVVLVAAKDRQTANVWVAVDEYALRTPFGPEMWRVARVYGTGQVYPSVVKHVGSYQDAPFVWHVLTIVEEKP